MCSRTMYEKQQYKKWIRRKSSKSVPSMKRSVSKIFGYYASINRKKKLSFQTYVIRPKKLRVFHNKPCAHVQWGEIFPEGATN